ncbi:hypothetical protein HDU81_006808 [Chytriomyces hyalinus]|nr:hypothetical protein HDU81_006808 [Chytriomyces hyalinus]
MSSRGYLKRVTKTFHAFEHLLWFKVEHVPTAPRTGSSTGDISGGSVGLNVSIGWETFGFKANQPMLQQTVTAPLLGDYNFNPFYNFTSLITASAISGPKGQPVKLSLVVAGVPNGFRIVFSALDFTEEVIVRAEISRNPTVITFATLIMIIMWFLALASVTFAGCLHVFEKKVEGAYLAFTIALLFAMSGVRNAMSSAPPIG